MNNGPHILILLNSMQAFFPISEPYYRGYGLMRPDGIRIDVIQCYENEWTIFMTLNGNVVARSIEEYRLHGNGNMPKVEAFRIARTLVNSANG
jgi:hypothetical protein